MLKFDKTKFSFASAQRWESMWESNNSPLTLRSHLTFAQPGGTDIMVESSTSGQHVSLCWPQHYPSGQQTSGSETGRKCTRYMVHSLAGTCVPDSLPLYSKTIPEPILSLFSFSPLSFLPPSCFLLTALPSFASY